ncbi:MAG: NAD(P)/FAD-dependent oxidoreductase [Nitrososphaerales archaeon]
MSPSSVVVAGGSVAGLLAAREAAAKGIKVTVLEEDSEIGTPEKCGGLVSSRISELGIPDLNKIVTNRVKRAKIFSASGISIALDVQRHNISVLDRRALDKVICSQASKAGASVFPLERVTRLENQANKIEVQSRTKKFTCDLVVDARGRSSMTGRDSTGLLPAAQYEVEGPWIDNDTVEVYLSQDHTPGFFTWVIPMGNESARVGAAGIGINGFEVVDKFLSTRPSSISKKIASSVVVSGPLVPFINDKVVSVGDAAGQTKPTTAGGIYTGGLAGVMAGKIIAESLNGDDPSILARYEKEWMAKFGSEFTFMKKARILIRRLTDKQIDNMFLSLKDSGIEEFISKEGDFDFHSRSILKALGIMGMGKLATSFAKREMSSLLSLGRIS